MSSPSKSGPIRSARVPVFTLAGAWESAAFAARTTAAAVIALASASALGLSHLYWAAMTVWLVAQPTRGLLLERSVLRVVGTLAGAAAGIGIGALLLHRPLALVAALTVWAALCAGAAAFVRPWRAYGFLLAGYTAPLVTLSALGEPGAAHGLILDRVLCTLVGVLSSTVVTALFTPRARRAGVDERLRALADHVFAFAAAAAARTSPGTRDLVARQRLLVAEVGAVGALGDQAIPGFVRERLRRRSLRRALRALMLVLVDSRLSATRRVEPCPTLALGSATGDELVCAIRRAAAACLAARAVAGDALDARRRSSTWARHRDAALASAKTVVGMALVTAVWVATGWRHAPTMLLSASVFLTLFSSNENARGLVVHILLGSTAGALAALLYQAVLSPGATAVATVVVAVPFLLVGAWAMARRTTAKAAIDFNMVFLMLAQPAYAHPADAAATAARGAALVLGVAAATAFFHVAREDHAERMARLGRDVLRDLRRLAAAPGPRAARLRDGALLDRVVSIAMLSRADDSTAPIADAAIDLLGLGRIVEGLVALRSDPTVRRAAALALRRMERGLHRPSACAAHLERMADLLARRATTGVVASRCAEELREAARIVLRERAFLDRPTPAALAA